MSQRILYLSGSGGLNDVAFLKKFRTLEPDWTTLFVATTEGLLSIARNLGLDTVFLNPHRLPYDDWDRKWEGRACYSFWERLWLKNRFRILRARYREILRDFRPHVVHSGWLQTEGLLAAKEKDCPLVVMEWGTDILIRPFDNRRNYRKTRFVLSRADLLLCDAQVALETEFGILGHRNARSLVIPWGVDRSLFRPDGRSFDLHRPLRIVMVKNLVPVSRMETIVEAAAILAESGALDFRIDIYGDGMLREKIEESVSNRSLQSRMRFHGRVPHGELPQILRENDVYVSCNQSEGTSVAMMEAMACGVIPVVTNLPAYREWITHERNGYLYDVGDAAMLARHLGDVTNAAPQRLHAMREINFATVAQHFDWDKNFSRLAQEYENLASLSTTAKT